MRFCWEVFIGLIHLYGFPVSYLFEGRSKTALSVCKLSLAFRFNGAALPAKILVEATRTQVTGSSNYPAEADSFAEACGSRSARSSSMEADGIKNRPPVTARL